MSARMLAFFPRVIALVALAGLSACQSLTPEEIAAREAAIEAAEDAECRSFGATPGSDAYVDCRLRLSEMAQTERIERRRAMDARMNAPLFGPSVVVERPVFVPAVREECVRYGGIVECRTY